LFIQKRAKEGAKVKKGDNSSQVGKNICCKDVLPLWFHTPPWYLDEEICPLHLYEEFHLMQLSNPFPGKPFPSSQTSGHSSLDWHLKRAKVF